MDELIEALRYHYGVNRNHTFDVIEALAQHIGTDASTLATILEGLAMKTIEAHPVDYESVTLSECEKLAHELVKMLGAVRLIVAPHNTEEVGG